METKTSDCFGYLPPRSVKPVETKTTVKEPNKIPKRTETVYVYDNDTVEIPKSDFDFLVSCFKQQHAGKIDVGKRLTELFDRWTA